MLYVSEYEIFTSRFREREAIIPFVFVACKSFSDIAMKRSQRPQVEFWPEEAILAIINDDLPTFPISYFDD